MQQGLTHFVGIGGIGMSGVAQLLIECGGKVSGSDVAENVNVTRLRQMGAQIYIGHDAAHVNDATRIVISTAVKSSNEEYKAALERKLPILHRSQMLAELMGQTKQTVCIAGAHGKTTTTSMVATLLDQGGKDPMVINGGIINAYGSNAKKGKTEWFVAEADESDGTFVNLPTTVAVITNIDYEHMDHYKTPKVLMEAFEAFVGMVPSHGRVVLGVDCPLVRELLQTLPRERCTTFAMNEPADITARNISYEVTGCQFDIYAGEKALIEKVMLPAFGDHNIKNALAAVAAAHFAGLSADQIRKGLESFEGVQRRFTPVGSWNGVTIIDDYAHHPAEIKAVLNAARAASKGRVIAVMQPHRYSRLHHHFEDFATSCDGADSVIVLPVYSAGEDQIDGIDHKTLVAKMTCQVKTCEGIDDLVGVLYGTAQPGDFVICMGAGSISGIARQLSQRLEDLQDNSRVCA